MRLMRSSGSRGIVYVLSCWSLAPYWIGIAVAGAFCGILGLSCWNLINAFGM